MLNGFILLFGISGGELLIIFLLAIVVFGPSKIPEIARMIAKGVNEVKKVQREINTEINRYSGDIEREARQMQRSLDDLKNDMLNPSSAKLSVSDELNDVIPNVYEVADNDTFDQKPADDAKIEDMVEEEEPIVVEKVKRKKRTKISDSEPNRSLDDNENVVND